MRILSATGLFFAMWTGFNCLPCSECVLLLPNWFLYGCLFWSGWRSTSELFCVLDIILSTDSLSVWIPCTASSGNFLQWTWIQPEVRWTSVKQLISGIYILLHIDFWIRVLLHFCFVWALCWHQSSATVFYLRNQHKGDGGDVSSFSALRTKQQMKVTSLGIIQGVLYFLASGLLMTEELLG